MLVISIESDISNGQVVNASRMQSRADAGRTQSAGTLSRQSRRRAIHAACHVTWHAYLECDGLVCAGVWAQTHSNLQCVLIYI